MVKIATVCMGSDPRDKAANRNKMIAYIEKAAAQEADLIVFPEEILTGVGTVADLLQEPWPCSTLCPCRLPYLHPYKAPPVLRG